jgi:hypothetical protein
MEPVAEAVVVGAGPNGLTAAIRLARAGVDVVVYEAASRVGGGARTDELTLPGFRHDTCSAVHPLGIGSPALRSLPLEKHGLEWLRPELALAHPFADGSAAVLTHSMDETAESLGRDGRAYRQLVEPFVGRWDGLANDLLRAPLAGWPRHPALLARFGLRGAVPASLLARRFRGDRGRALLAGLAAHTITPLTSPGTSGVALMFALAAHEAGWPVPRGGSQAISDALAALLISLGGRVETDRRVHSLAELPAARAYLLDTDPGHQRLRAAHGTAGRSRGAPPDRPGLGRHPGTGSHHHQRPRGADTPQARTVCQTNPHRAQRRVPAHRFPVAGASALSRQLKREVLSTSDVDLDTYQDPHGRPQPPRDERSRGEPIASGLELRN